MSHYGLLGNYVTDDPARDIRGRTLYGLNDEELGQITDVIFDHATGQIMYIVVDTGGWLKTKKFVVPANRLRRLATYEDDFACDLTKPQIESFPPYDENDLETQAKWSAYEGIYRDQWPEISVIRPAASSMVMGGRWDTFQALLRRRLNEAIAECGSCTEDAGDLKKAV